MTHLDSLGREVVAIAHNRFERSGAISDEKYVTYTKLDAEGKPLWIQDARGNRVMEYINRPGAETDFVPCYDIAGNLLFQHSMDGGDRWMLMDATGQPFYAWDRNERVADGGTLVLENRIFHTTYDALRRPLEQQLQINGGTPPQVIEGFIYGESQPEAQERNLRGQVYQHYDPSGLMTNQRFDFKGNLLEATRQLTQIYDEPVIDWNTEPPLEERFTQRTEYDALNRMTRLENWHRGDRADRPPAVYIPQYNQRGVLVSETLSVRGRVTEAILHIEYDAKGQRTRIQYGNGTTTRYHYDPETFRLVQLRTTRTSPGERLPTLPSNLSNPNVLQNLYYTYDPVGNITEIHDDAYEPVFFNNQGWNRAMPTPTMPCIG
ncbi:MAG: RHS repeat protein [Coleofasciculaceae cyanobacterium SM2_3_26]|nr:RHS repeat protein [Coleofasciculaceae cyanobacterium SM2_3_26]